MSNIDIIQAHFQLALMEARQAQLRAEHFKVRIDTGVWKDRVGHVRVGGSTGPFANEAICIRDEVQTMNAHIRRAEDCLDAAKGYLADLKTLLK